MASDKKAKFVSRNTDLWNFVVSRNRIRENPEQQIEKVRKSNRRFLKEECFENNVEKTKTIAQAEHIIGKYPKNLQPCIKYSTKTGRDLVKAIDWQLPPNAYDTNQDPFGSKRGSGGAYWRKLPENIETPFQKAKAAKSTKAPKEKPSEPQPKAKSKSCSAHKGKFLTNARERKATARNMVSDPALIYRDPKEPSAAAYKPCQHELSYNIDKVKCDPLPESVSNPHRFWPQTCVPLVTSSTVPPHTSFKPGPGRYDTRFLNICTCSSRKIYVREFHIIVDREKRNKFRRLPFQKYTIKRYCSPDLAHIPFQGHRHVFELPVADVQSTKEKKKKKKGVGRVEKLLQLYPTARYINMINRPDRKDISKREVPLKPRPPAVRYNTLAKPRLRRHPRDNKKIAFLSGQDRFPDSGYHPKPMTFKELEQIKNSLPPDRQLRDYPVFTKDWAEITSHLLDMPDHMKPAYPLELRKPEFKFLPLPEPKILVSRERLFEGLDKPMYFFNKPVDVTKFFKKDVPEPAEINENTENTEIKEENETNETNERKETQEAPATNTDINTKQTEEKKIE